MSCMYRVMLRVNTSPDEEPKEPCIQDWGVLVGRKSLQGSLAAKYAKGGLSLVSHSSNKDDPILTCRSASVRPYWELRSNVCDPGTRQSQTIRI